MNNLVKLPNGVWVNPRYVTCIEVCYPELKRQTKVRVVKDSGYGTGSFAFNGDIRDQLAAIINQEWTK